MNTAAYGSWPSPVDAALTAAHDGRPEYPGAVGDELWWIAPRPAEGGRRALVRRRADGTEETVLPAPWNVRNRVLEYGGRPWTAADRPGDGPLVVFCHFPDQRLYAYEPDAGPGAEPRPLTPSPPSAADCAGPTRWSTRTGARCGASWRSSPGPRRPTCAGCPSPCRSTAPPPGTARPCANSPANGTGS